MPTWGLRVVNGYAATLGLARDMALSSVDLPAFGKPTCKQTLVSFTRATMLPLKSNNTRKSGKYHTTLNENLFQSSFLTDDIRMVITSVLIIDTLHA